MWSKRDHKQIQSNFHSSFLSAKFALLLLNQFCLKNSYDIIAGNGNHMGIGMTAIPKIVITFKISLTGFPKDGSFEESNCSVVNSPEFSSILNIPSPE